MLIVAIGVADVLQGNPPWSIRSALVPTVAAIMFARSWIAQATLAPNQRRAVWLLRAVSVAIIALALASLIWPGRMVWALLSVVALVMAGWLAIYSWRLRKAAKVT